MIELRLDGAINPKNSLDIITINEIQKIDIKKFKIYWINLFFRWVWKLLSYDTTTDLIKKNEEKIIIKIIDGRTRSLDLQTCSEEIKNKFINLNH